MIGLPTILELECKIFIHKKDRSVYKRKYEWIFSAMNDDLNIEISSKNEWKKGIHVVDINVKKALEIFIYSCLVTERNVGDMWTLS